MVADHEVTVVIPQRNHASLTLDCIRSLRRFERINVIIMDDGSADDSVSAIRRANLPDCELIQQPPRGVTTAWNAGIRRVETPFVLLLNNDVAIEGPFVERLVMPLRNREAMIAGVEWRTEPLIPRQVIPNRQLLAGWCLAFEKRLWSRLGGFDESLRLYWSDADFQCRAAILDSASETALTAVSTLPLRHLGHRTTQQEPRRTSLWHADRIRFLAKWKAEFHAAAAANL